MANRKSAPQNVRFSRIGQDFKGEKAALYNRVNSEETAKSFQEKLAAARTKLDNYTAESGSGIDQKIEKMREIIQNLEQSLERCKGK